MSTVRAPRVAPVRSRTAAVRPALRVVGEPGVQRHPSPSKVGTVVGVIVFAVLFALAGLHTLLVNGQASIDDLNGRIAAEESRHLELKLSLATLQSPERINETARDRLGMIQPEMSAFLTPTSNDDDMAALVDPTGPDRGASDSTLASTADTTSVSGASYGNSDSQATASGNSGR